MLSNVCINVESLYRLGIFNNFALVLEKKVKICIEVCIKVYDKTKFA